MRKGYHYNLNPTFKNVFSPKNLGMINTTTNCKYYVLMGHIILLNDSRPTAKLHYFNLHILSIIISKN